MYRQLCVQGCKAHMALLLDKPGGALLSLGAESLVPEE